MNIISPKPGLFKDIDAEKLKIITHAQRKAMEPFRWYTRANEGQWCICAVSNPVWAEMVFPELSKEEAEEQLWEAILNSVRVRDDNDAEAEWHEHNQALLAHNKILTDLKLKSLHFKNNLGTDLTVELPAGHRWEGGSEHSTHGVLFSPNMPTEETFTMPLKTGVNGTVRATKPLDYQGKLIRDFSITFDQGKAVSWTAAENEEMLANLINTDEGSAYLGEVALISHQSPISDSGLLFYNTLFDENASCHLALGACYPSNLEGGLDMSEEELEKRGGNHSMVHSDFMFGSADMQITGMATDGKEIEIFRNGNFVI